MDDARFSKVSNAEPSPETLQRFDQIARHMKEAKMLSDPALIEFVTSNTSLTWKGQLGKTGAVFVSQRRGRDREAAQGPIFVAKQDVSIRKGEESLAPKTLKVTCSIQGRKLSGLMSQEAFQRYEAWKIGIKNRVVAD